MLPSLTALASVPTDAFASVPTDAFAAVTTDQTGGSTSPVRLAVALVVAVVVAWLASLVVAALVRRATRSSALATDVAPQTHRATRALLVAVALDLAVTRAAAPATWVTVVDHVLVVAAIASAAWLLGSAAMSVARAAGVREEASGPGDPRTVDRAQAQVRGVRALTVPLLVTAATGVALVTLPGAAAAGAVVLGLAGLLGVATVVAARDVLADLAAGVRLAFGDAVRVDDVVVVEGQWGRVEQITLVHVVVQLWDDRRLVLPTSRVTSSVLESWSRTDDGPLGTVDLDLDWTVPVEAVRGELERLLTQDELWDGRVGVLQVLDAVGGSVRVRALLSAGDAPALDDLRCAVREGLLGWVQQHGRDALPRTRQEQVGAAPVRPPAPPTPPRAAFGETQAFDIAGQRARQFTGSLEGLERAQAFAGPGPAVLDVRAGRTAAPVARAVARPVVVEAAQPAAVSEPVAARRSASSAPVGGAPRPTAAGPATPASAPVIVVGRGQGGPVAAPATPDAGATQVFGGPIGQAPSGHGGGGPAAPGYGTSAGYGTAPGYGSPHGGPGYVDQGGAGRLQPPAAPQAAPAASPGWSLDFVEPAGAPTSPAYGAPVRPEGSLDSTQVFGARPTVERRSTRREMRP
ncbi:mechanosensitive ion channel family protein [Cellulomonas soli]|uniref:mechanosensitive ion channel family protein n=1 Tax=Cellulomonas soli TaxID=931535 RepID=UPI0015C6BE03|nr:mechanosensitive ion channel family protein [Cellulomonas soli]NYI57638.1 small-conductance mechanosensitive channel [Cellulomonas soli]